MNIKKLHEGIGYDGNRFHVRFFSNEGSDIIDIAEPHITQSSFDNKTYYFGYEFKPEVSSTVRGKFFRWIKGLDKNSKPDEFTLENLVAMPIDELNRSEKFSQFSCVLYPRSNRSELTHMIQRCVLNCIPRTKIKSFELVKNIPANVNFDWELFDEHYKGEVGDTRYQQISNYVNNDLLPKIHSLDYFSIAENIKYKYRNYIMNFLTVPEETQDAFKALTNSDKVLIIDDINTSGATLREMIRVVKTLAPETTIYIFTLIDRGEKVDNV